MGRERGEMLIDYVVEKANREICQTFVRSLKAALDGGSVSIEYEICKAADDALRVMDRMEKDLPDVLEDYEHVQFDGIQEDIQSAEDQIITLWRTHVEPILKFLADNE